MFKIGVCLESKNYQGGVHQYSIALLDALMQFPKDKYEICAVCTNDEWQEYCKENLVPYYRTERYIRRTPFKDIIISHLLWGHAYGDLLDCKKHNIDLMFFPSVSENPFYISCKKVCAIHDLMHRYEKNYPEIASTKHYFLREIVYRRIVKHSDIILTDSLLGKKHVEDCYLHGRNDNRIKPLPYIPPKYMYETINEGQEWKKLKSKLPPKYLFYPAQFWKHKNHINILRAINELKEALPDLRIVFVGSNHNSDNLVKEYICENNLEENVTILGYVDNECMAALYKHAVALVMASVIGPTNIPQLEAFLLGCPVLVSDVYAVSEQVGDAALLFDPYDYHDIAKQIERIWTDDELRNELIDKGYERAKNWGPEQFMQRLLSYCNDISYGCND